MTAGATCLSRYVSPTLSTDILPVCVTGMCRQPYRLTPCQPQNSRLCINCAMRVVWNRATGWICLWPHVIKVLDWSGRRRRMWHHNPPHCLEPSSSSSSGWCLIISVATTLITTWGDDVTGSTRNTPVRGGVAGVHVDRPYLHRLCE